MPAWLSVLASVRAPCVQSSAMPKMTLLARISDGLPLAASMEDEKDHRELDGWKTQAKKIIKQMTAASPSKLSIESGTSYFHYMHQGGVCYLCLTDKGYPKRLAFNYLEEVCYTANPSASHRTACEHDCDAPSTGCNRLQDDPSLHDHPSMTAARVLRSACAAAT